MNTSSDRQDKFALLFSGSTASRYVADLNRIFDVLTKFYNYPPEHITVVFGGLPNPALHCPGAAIHDVATLADLDKELAACAAAATGDSRTALLYFTGDGALDPAGGSALRIGDVAFAANDFAPCLERFRCQINVVMQQSYGGGFRGAFARAKRWSFAYASNGVTYANNSTGGFFTEDWADGLKLEQLPAGAPQAGETAYALGPHAKSELISLGAAAEFARQKELASWGRSTVGYADDGAGPYYLGAPELLINDGNPWFESPDIYLTHPPSSAPDDLYLPDDANALPPFQNTIGVRTTNIGTHPVRRYSLDIQMVETGMGPTLLGTTFRDHVPAAGPLLPNHSDTVSWNARFPIGSTHACIRAEARLRAAEIDGVWDIGRQNYEAQRNVDPMPIAVHNVKEHEYAITNRFDRAVSFLVLIPPEARDASKVSLTWFAKSDDELQPLTIIEQPQPHLLVSLEPRQTRTLVLQARMSEAMPAGEVLRIPFSIAIEHQRALVEVAGVTVALRQAAATVEGTVVDENGKVAANALVRVETIDGRGVMTVRTDAAGRYALHDVNPDVYRITTQRGKEAASKTFVLRDSERRRLDVDHRLGVRVKVVLDRIRVLDDHDRGRGKGEIVFNSVIVPDANPAARQVTRLPAKGAYHVSDRPGSNDLRLGVIVFDGVVKSGALDLTIDGMERDPNYRTEKLPRYHRTLSGDLAGARQENVGDWALWYHIEKT